MPTASRKLRFWTSGIAKVMEREGKSKTRVNAKMGTPVYMSPEQIRGQRRHASGGYLEFGGLTFRIGRGQKPV